MLPKHYTNEQTGIRYTLHGDYYLPDLVLTEQMKESEGITEELKEQNQLEWVGRMNNLRERANEIVCSELIYA